MDSSGIDCAFLCSISIAQKNSLFPKTKPFLMGHASSNIDYRVTLKISFYAIINNYSFFIQKRNSTLT